MRWTLAGIAIGVGIAVLLVILIETLGNQVAAPIPNLNAAEDAPSPVPVATLIFPLVGWFAGALAGGVAAIWFSRRSWTAWIVAGAVLIGVLLRVALSSHPFWLMAAGVAAPLIAAWLAQRIAPKRTIDLA